MITQRLLKILSLLILLTALGCKEDLNLIHDLPKNTSQVLLVESASKGSTNAQLTAWENRKGTWRQVMGPIDAVVGKKGVAILGGKREGDGRTPSGIYPLGHAFGYGESFDGIYPYRQATDQDFWVDDPESSQYNQWITGPPLSKSFERLKRDDELYKYGVVIEYNMRPVVAYRGSAIFLHIWRNAKSPTAGCVAVSEKNLLKVIRWLDPAKNPVIAIKESD